MRITAKTTRTLSRKPEHPYLQLGRIDLRSSTTDTQALTIACFGQCCKHAEWQDWQKHGHDSWPPVLFSRALQSTWCCTGAEPLLSLQLCISPTLASVSCTGKDGPQQSTPTATHSQVVLCTSWQRLNYIENGDGRSLCRPAILN